MNPDQLNWVLGAFIGGMMAGMIGYVIGYLDGKSIEKKKHL